ncbi:hypothetical protein KSP40_PGU000305 [Platanthera guangdongensis]|uniref:MHD1 domain-containing protein n=1 Tax=Platanthera guangdongensis TaxID=2320717 RepID=A0ABR2MSR8_9ASPA
MARRDSPNSSISASSQSATSITSGDSEIDWPFGARLDTLRHSEIRETAYEIFFMCCRFSPGFGSNKGAIAYVGSTGDVVEAPSSSTPSRPTMGRRGGTGMMTVTSRVKTTLGLRAGRPPPMRTMNYSMGLTAVAGESPYAFMPNSPGRITVPSSPNKAKRPMTSAEIMRRQMRITTQSDNMLKKILQRSFLGQNGRRAESFILPLELLRHIKPSEFSDNQEYHQWQRRQLKILQVGLLIHPSLPLDRLNTAALQFREILLHSEMKPIDTSKNSDVMHRLSNAVTALAWRNSSTVGGGCHWADGFPVNVHLYLALLKSIFDMREENVVLDEVDELLELMKKTWPILGINRMIHNVCFTWVLFQQYVITGQLEPDLIRATLNMLVEVANDAKMQAMERDHNYAMALDGVITSMQGWAEKRLLDYHENFNKGNVENMGNILSLALATTKIVVENIPGMAAGNTPGLAESDAAAAANRVEFYIQRSMRNAFTRVFETGAPGHIDSMIVEVDEDPSDILIQLATDVEALAVVERENFSPVLRHWCPAALGVALLTLHSCFGVIFKQYLAKMSSLSKKLVLVLQCAGKLEKQLMQMAADDSADYDDGGRSSVLRDMIPYEVDTIGAGLLKTWVDERLAVGRESVSRAKETENWMPKSKGEQFTESVMELIKLAKVTADDFSKIQLMSARDEMVHDLADGLESIFQDYANFAASCDELTKHIQQAIPWCLLFVDDIILVDETREDVNAKLESWRDTLEKKSFRLSRAMTGYMELKFSSAKRTDDFVIKLGDQDISHMNYVHEEKMGVVKMRMLRWMCGHMRLDKIWNESIRDKTGVAPIAEKMREAHLRLFEPVQRRQLEARWLSAASGSSAIDRPGYISVNAAVIEPSLIKVLPPAAALNFVAAHISRSIGKNQGRCL